MATSDGQWQIGSADPGVSAGPVESRRLRRIGWRAKFRVKRTDRPSEEVRVWGLSRSAAERRALRLRHETVTRGLDR